MPTTTIHQIAEQLHQAECPLNPTSKAMCGVMPDTLQAWYNSQGINKTVPIGESSLGSFMEKNVDRALATEIARVRYFEPHGLDTLTYKEIASLLLGIVYHLPSLSNSVVGDALSRLGSPKTIYKDFEVKERKRQSRIDQTWLAELDAYSLRAGVVPTYNAVHDSIRLLYEERGNTNDIKNRLERVWPRMDDGCGNVPEGPQPQMLVSNPTNNRNLFGGTGMVIEDHAANTCDPYKPAPLSFPEKASTKLKGFFADLTGIRHVRQNDGVVWPFFRSLGVVLLVVGIGVFGIKWAKSKII